MYRLLARTDIYVLKIDVPDRLASKSGGAKVDSSRNWTHLIMDASVDKGIPDPDMIFAEHLALKMSLVGNGDGKTAPYVSDSSDEIESASFIEATKSGHGKYCQDNHGKWQGMGEVKSVPTPLR